MRLALAEAELAPLTGDVPVGAVVLSADGSVLARARNEREATGDPTAHAEILAIRRAAAALAGRAASAGKSGASSTPPAPSGPSAPSGSPPAPSGPSGPSTSSPSGPSTPQRPSAPPAPGARGTRPPAAARSADRTGDRGDGRTADRGADWQLTGCTLLVTLEPCTMCAGAIVLSRLDRVVYAARDAKAGAAGSQWDLVRDRRLNHRPEVIGGVLGAPAAGLLTRFFRAADFGPPPPMG